MAHALEELLQSDAQPAVAISTLDGSSHRGHVLSLGLPKGPSAHQAVPQPAAIEFRPQGTSTPVKIEWPAVKAVHFVRNLDREPDEHENVRFFDSAAIPPYLWVRVDFTDGEIIEGKVDNSSALMNGPCLLLYPLDETSNQQCICIPRAAIANLQVITFRR